MIYFLMVALDKSWVVPLTVMMTVPFALIGILSMLLLTGTAINVQSVLGMIFIVGNQGIQHRSDDRLRSGAAQGTRG